SPVTSEVFHLLDPDSKFERRDPAHRRQAWAISTQRHLETFIKVTRLVAVALETAEKLQRVFDQRVIHADFRRSCFEISARGVLLGASEMSSGKFHRELEAFWCILGRRIHLRALFFDDHLERWRGSQRRWL